MKMAFLAATAVMLAAAPAQAQQVGGAGGSGASLQGDQREVPQGAATGGVNANGERLICRRVEVESSSRMSLRRVCLTAREWRERE